MSSQQSKDTHLCAYCVAATQKRNPNFYMRSTQNTVNQKSRGSLLLLRIHDMAAKIDKADEPAHKADIAKLEAWSSTMVDAINARDFSNPLFKLATPDFKASSIDVFPPTFTPAAHLETFRKMAEENPEYHMHLQNVHTDLECKGKYARVYLTIRVTGRPLGLTRGCVGVFTWRRRERGEGWWLISHESMRNWGMNCEPSG